ncbi:DNA-primase RepB domain-containing protein [Deinococcus aerophilus]|uniref:RepB-like DNA primase domain-containing protein n=1 Tax=Deinococcus aerophilus TaxID=522488 RepID=A0ABQ2GML4_9DEIO|nr:DNA-primase RepB domain-containing protein [Deinococcus aerophilus]GGM02503.1 hypothetical protein GCM10010841_08790 [Deinococcus aerophilus]
MTGSSHDAEEFRAQFNGRQTFQTFDDRHVEDKRLSRVLFDSTALDALNRQGAGIFLMINEGDGVGRKNHNVTRIRAYWADFDGQPLPDRWPLEPSLLVESSPGRFHAYWILNDHETPPLDGQAFNAQQEALARAVGSCPDDCKGLARVMRVPGFQHQKGELFTTRILSNTGARFTLAQIQDAFPLSTEPGRSVIPQPTPSHQNEQPMISEGVRRKYALNTLHGLADELAQMKPGGRNRQLNAAAFRVGRLCGGGHLNREESEACLWKAAEAAGLSASEIGDTLPRALADGMTQPDPLDHVGQRLSVNSREGRRHSTASGLPEIVVNERHLREIAAEAQAALMAANTPPTLFQRGGEVVRLITHEGEPRLRAMDAVALKGWLARVADFVVLKERTEKTEHGKKQVVTDSRPARPPADLAPDLLARSEHLGLPPLRTLAKSPIYAPGGALISVEGYHAPSGIYLALRGMSVPTLPPVPDALTLLRKLLTDFPFSPHEAGFAHTLAAMLLPFVRPMIDGPTPLHLIEAPTRGSGKGLLSEVIAHVTQGGPAGVMVQTKDGDEFEKRVTSMLLESAPVVLLDNVIALKGEALAAALTSSIWRGRRLGRSEMLTLPNGALWLATGNNVILDDDMPRRIIPIRLDPGVERPEERTGFTHPDLRGWIKANRPALVAACLSLIEAWKAAGRPEGSARLGSFEKWTATIGGILDVAGVPGFLTGREELYETANAAPQEWVALLAALHNVHGSQSIGAKDVLAAMRALDLCSDYWEGRQNTSALKRVGRAVTQQRDRVFGGYRLRLAGKTATGNAAYRIEPSQQKQRKTPETSKTPGRPPESSSESFLSPAERPDETPCVSTDFTRSGQELSEKHRDPGTVPDGSNGVSGVYGVISAAEDAVEI